MQQTTDTLIGRVSDPLFAPDTPPLVALCVASVVATLPDEET